MGGQQPEEGGELELVQRDVVTIEVDDIDRSRVLREVGEHVAAAGTDR